MPRRAIPDRWEEYNPVCTSVGGTNIIPFKTPLRESVFYNHPNIHPPWSPRDVVRAFPNLGLVIDLSFAQHPRYQISDFENCGVHYERIPCAGREIPAKSCVDSFAQCVSSFCSNPLNHRRLIGVHCTHGVNRTGYVVCKYLIDYLNVDPRDAIHRFQEARGYAIERENYVEDLLRSNSYTSDVYFNEELVEAEYR